MKKIAAFTAIFIFILVLTKIANQAPPPQMPGIAFSLMAQHVVECTPTEITLVDVHETETHLMKDESWPPCASFQAGQVLDFYLARGARTHFIRDEPTVWWRKDM